MEMSFLRINAANDHNPKMNAVDVSDQLRNHHRMDHWLRQRKWWWSIFLWSFGVLLANAWKVCGRVMDEAGVPVGNRMTHCDFLHQIAVAWIDLDEVDPKQRRRLRRKKERQAEKAARESASPQESAASPRRSPAKRARRGCAPPRVVEPSPTSPSPKKKKQDGPKRAPRLNDDSLNPDCGALRKRLDHTGVFHCPVPPAARPGPPCALHRHSLGRDIGSLGQARGGILTCEVCNVNLCAACFKTHHTERDIASKKIELANKLQDHNWLVSQ